MYHTHTQNPIQKFCIRFVGHKTKSKYTIHSSKYHSLNLFLTLFLVKTDIQKLCSITPPWLWWKLTWFGIILSRTSRNDQKLKFVHKVRYIACIFLQPVLLEDPWGCQRPGFFILSSKAFWEIIWALNNFQEHHHELSWHFYVNSDFSQGCSTLVCTMWIVNT